MSSFTLISNEVATDEAEDEIYFNVIKHFKEVLDWSLIGLKNSEDENSAKYLNILHIYNMPSNLQELQTGRFGEVCSSLLHFFQNISTNKFRLSRTVHILNNQQMKYCLSLTLHIFFVWETAQIKTLVIFVKWEPIYFANLFPRIAV